MYDSFSECCFGCIHVRDVGLIPGLGRSPGGEHSNPLQYSCLDCTSTSQFCGLWIVFVCLLLREVICSQQKMRGNYGDFPYTFSLQKCPTFPIINISHQSSTFVTTDEPTLILHNHKRIHHLPSSCYCTFILLLHIHLVIAHSVGLDKRIMTCIHHYISYKVFKINHISKLVSVC